MVGRFTASDGYSQSSLTTDSRYRLASLEASFRLLVSVGGTVWSDCALALEELLRKRWCRECRKGEGAPAPAPDSTDDLGDPFRADLVREPEGCSVGGITGSARKRLTYHTDSIDKVT